jgi:hypothetical protein
MCVFSEIVHFGSSIVSEVVSVITHSIHNCLDMSMMFYHAVFYLKPRIYGLLRVYKVQFSKSSFWPDQGSRVTWFFCCGKTPRYPHSGVLGESTQNDFEYRVNRFKLRFALVLHCILQFYDTHDHTSKVSISILVF